jgi:transposase InsO family protein
VLHGNARLTVHGRRLLVTRVIDDRRPIAHVAKEVGVSRQCATRWVNRFRAEGEAGLQDRSSRPNRTPSRTSPEREQAVLDARAGLRQGPQRIAAATGVPARTVSRILARHHVPPLAWLDPITGHLIRATRSTAQRYERERPGELVHVDVKKLGRIPDGGGWRTNTAWNAANHKTGHKKVGFDYVHSAVDDHSRFAYSEIHPDERAETCAGFLTRAAAAFAAAGISRIERIITDNAFAYRRSAAFRAAAAAIGAEQRFIKPHCPWTNGKVERFNRTLQTEWAYRRPFTSNTERSAALAPWLQHYNHDRIHTGTGTTPAARTSRT